MSATPSTSAAVPRKNVNIRYGDDDDDDDFAPDVERKADWKSNPWVPLGAFGGAVALGVSIVVARRNAGWSLSQTIMQARVLAQGACVAGLIGVGAYTTYEARREDAAENARVAKLNARKQ